MVAKIFLTIFRIKDPSELYPKALMKYIIIELNMLKKISKKSNTICGEEQYFESR